MTGGPMGKSGEEFLSSLYRFPSGDIEMHTRDDLTVFKIRGTYSGGLFNELIKLLARIKGAVSIDLSELKKINISTVGFLENLARKVNGGGGDFVLLNPDGRLRDLLNLSGKMNRFKTMEADFDLPKMKTASEKKNGAKTELKRGGTDGRDTERSIVHMSRDLRKVTSFEKEMDTAERRQKQLLPTACPMMKGFDIHASYEPCEKVGGDFYDFIELPGGKIGIAIADVSGHGVVAALYMGMLKMVLQIRAPEYESPAAVLRAANTDLEPWIERNAFISVFYAVLDPIVNSFRFARAGHNFPVFFENSSGKAPVEIDSPGFVLGVVGGGGFDSAIKDHRITLHRDDEVFLYTDGLVEAKNGEGEEFGKENLFKAMVEHGGSTSEELIKELKQRVRKFAGNRPLDDDITMLCIKVR